MPNEFERQGIPSGSENPKEVKPVDEGFSLLRAQHEFRELQARREMTDEEALDYVVEHMGVDKTRFKAWLRDVENNKDPLPVQRPEMAVRRNHPKYPKEERPKLWFNQGQME